MARPDPVTATRMQYRYTFTKDGVTSEAVMGEPFYRWDKDTQRWVRVPERYLYRDVNGYMRYVVDDQLAMPLAYTKEPPPGDEPEPDPGWTRKEVAIGAIIGVPIGLLVMWNVAPWFWGSLILLAMFGLMAAGGAWIWERVK